MSNNIDRVVSLSILEGGNLAGKDNVNICALFTSQVGKLNSLNRTQSYTSSNEVATDFGTNSDVYKHALVFFSQSPNPIQAGGRLVVAYHRAVTENMSATNGKLSGVQLSETSLLGQLQQISDGSFDITIDGTIQNVTNLDFRTSTSFKDVISILNTSISGATATEEDQKIVITSNTTGSSSKVSFLSDSTTGTSIGGTMGLKDGSGATIIDGIDITTFVPETKLNSLQLAKQQSNFKNFVFIDNPTDTECQELAQYAQANEILSVDIFNSSTNLEVDINNIVWEIKSKGLSNYRMLFSSSNQRTLATAYMSRLHTINFNAENSAMTMHLKELKGVTAENYTAQELDSAYRVGLDVYTYFKDVPKVLTSPSNDFADNRYNLISFKDTVKTDLFNVLAGTSTKIPQTTKGVNQLVSRVEATCALFARAGYISAGSWNSTDSFGDIDRFNSNIESNGYYVLAGKLSNQAQSERENRKSPIIQVAIKLAGAIHSTNLIININK